MSKGKRTATARPTTTTITKQTAKGIKKGTILLTSVLGLTSGVEVDKQQQQRDQEEEWQGMSKGKRTAA